MPEIPEHIIRSLSTMPDPDPETLHAIQALAAMPYAEYRMYERKGNTLMTTAVDFAVTWMAIRNAREALAYA